MLRLRYATLPRNLVDLLTDQVEFANVIVINKVDQLDTEQLERLEAMLCKLNPDAQRLRSKGYL